MSFYDIIILAVLFGAMYFGYTKGLAWQIASVAAVVVSYFAAVRFRGQVAPFVQADPPYNYIAAMLIIFIACSLVIWMVYAYVNRSLEKAELDGFNRQIGALVGAVLGVLLIMVITMFSVSLLGTTAHDSIHKSRLGGYVVRGISLVQAFVPEELDASLDPHFEKFYQQMGYQPQSNSNLQGYIQNAVSGGSQYANGQTFLPNSQTSFEGNWNTSPAQPTQNVYQNSGYPNNGYQPNQTQTGYGYQPAPGAQGAYTPQQPQQQQQPSLPPIQLKLDTENLFNGVNSAGQWIKNNVASPNGN